MGERPTETRSRRSFVAGAWGAALALGGTGWLTRRSSAQSDVGSCLDEPAMEIFFAWDTGQLPYPLPGETSPPSHWQPVNLPGGAPPWAIPPGWTVENLYAENLSQDGTIQWRRRLNGLPLLELTRVMSEDGSAVFESSAGTLQGLTVDSEDMSSVALASLLGADARVRNVCYQELGSGLQDPIYRRVERTGRDLVYSFGSATPMPDPNMTVTVFWYYNFLGPRRQMEDLMWEAFIPLMDQHLVKGGGGSTPTPTPTPGF